MLNNSGVKTFKIKVSKLANMEKVAKTVASSAKEIETAEEGLEDLLAGTSDIGHDNPRADLIVDEVMWNEDDFDEDAGGYFRPSMVGGCKRANYFFYTGVKRQKQRHDPKMKMVLKVGKVYHEEIQKYLGQSQKVYFSPESPVWDENLKIRGSCDGILIMRDLSAKWPLEIKTISSSGFKTLTKPKPEHLMQTHIYSALHGCFNFMDILYICKDNQTKRCFRVPFNPDLWKEIQEWIQMMHTYVTKRIVPRYEEKKCTAPMGFCRFMDHCYKLKDMEDARKAKAG